MTISSTSRKAGPFSGNGVTASFPFTFKVFAESDVVVVKTDPAGIESTLTTGYTVALNVDQDATPGGAVTLPAPLGIGYLLTATSAIEELQSLDLTNQGGFYPKVLNAALDRLTILVQQVKEQVGRAVKVGISSSATPDELISAISSAATLSTAAASTATAAASTAAIAASDAADSAAAAASSAGAITPVETQTHAAASKATPVDADELPLVDSAASNVLKKLTWANIKATLKTYFDTLYKPISYSGGISFFSASWSAGVALDFTGLPSSAKEFIISFAGVSTTGTSSWLIQIGSGSILTSGYLGHVSSGGGLAANTSGFQINNNVVAANTYGGSVKIALTASNAYSEDGVIAAQGTANSLATSGGNVTLAGVLDRIRITSVGGSDTGDGGSISVLCLG